MTKRAWSYTQSTWLARQKNKLARQKKMRSSNPRPYAYRADALPAAIATWIVRKLWL
uniref:Uncharacterized protein n=1 Tax=Romanomermis culicivorax TaxID=13658 RepID=A0A915II37_ROMCU